MKKLKSWGPFWSYQLNRLPIPQWWVYYILTFYPHQACHLHWNCIAMTAVFTQNDHFFKPDQIDWKRLICSAFNQNDQVWKKLSFWMKIVIILRISPLSIRVSYFVSTWDKSSDSWANSQKLTDVDYINQKSVWSQSAIEFYNLFVDSWVIFPWLSN